MFRLLLILSVLVFVSSSALAWDGKAYSDREALEKLKEAAQKGDPSVEYNLGHAIEHTELSGVYDQQEALKWYRKAAEQGYAPAQFQIARRVNGLEAEEWYRKAADRGLTDAQIALSALYSKDETPGHPGWAEAFYWRLIAKKNAREYLNLYSKVELSSPESHDMVTSPCEKIYDEEEALNSLKRHLKAEEIVSVEKRVVAWRPMVPAGVVSNDDVIEKFLAAQRDHEAGGAAALEKRVGYLEGDNRKSDIVLLWRKGSKYYLTIFSDVTGTFQPADTLELKGQNPEALIFGYSVIGIIQTGKKITGYQWRNGKLSEADPDAIKYIQQCESPPVR